MQSPAWFSFLADLVTVLAGVIAVAGVVWAFTARARLVVESAVESVSVTPSLTVRVSSSGSSPIMSLTLELGLLDQYGFSRAGSGEQVAAVFERGEMLSIHVYERGSVHWGSSPQPWERRVELEPGGGAYIRLQWQSPLFPWMRISRTFAWTSARRFAGEQPQKLRGSKELAFLRSTSDPKLDVSSPEFDERLAAPFRAQRATDGGFAQMVADAQLPVVAVFGASWLGPWWEDIQRGFDAFSRKHQRRIVGIVVEIDKCPGVATGFGTTSLPTYLAVVKGASEKTHVGSLPMPKLEHEFKHLLH